MSERDDPRPTLDHLPDAVISATLDDEIVSANRAAEALLGYAPGTLIGRRIQDIIPERYRAAHREGMARYRASRVPVLIGRVYSMDHVAVNRDVIACDMAAVPLEDDALDVAIFCLSLMGTNCTDYVPEARRCLRLDGQLHIWEPASYFSDVDAFCRDLEKLSFDVVEPRTEGAFVRIYAVRTAAKPVAGSRCASEEPWRTRWYQSGDRAPMQERRSARLPTAKAPEP